MAARWWARHVVWVVLACAPVSARAEGAVEVDAGIVGSSLARPSARFDLAKKKPDPTLTTVTADAPELTRRNDGTYAYKGRGFDAVIESDGTVRMHDVFLRAGLTFKPRITASGDWIVTFFEAKYDLMGWLERKMHNDPYRSERRWLFERTHALREQLAFRAVAEKMQGVLNALWSQVGLDFAERKRRTFALWDQSSEDEFGELCRARVVDFVRARCPRDTGLGFSDEELRVLNGKRRSRAVFAPYLDLVPTGD
jgi:hypothetical protein